VRSRPRITCSIKPPVCQNHTSLPMDAQHDHGARYSPNTKSMVWLRSLRWRRWRMALCQYDTASDHTPFERILPSVIGGPA
jgi:hypothetical protein